MDRRAIPFHKADDHYMLSQECNLRVQLGYVQGFFFNELTFMYEKFVEISGGTLGKPLSTLCTK